MHGGTTAKPLLNKFLLDGFYCKLQSLNYKGLRRSESA